ncbi:tRNA (adenosine(37)-N6)-dimethylallyltransferase MiaA [Gillisia sp. M10.2A]|uniref:tRNA dimethylallyltransferase n=1 Tax=Gillisia lutea TaxID=2909668 RepID=A0ABS9EDI2_9FLAO|nr:tRNA (adenosine(37)-N6)-dimethylallyltransferase MiaA [Gillisia lutea]MCF4100943.1 tRNA (adenosine(37)-N6)-dimethylallyltransferase MiaA [Gillisia lutea]
MKNKFLICIAGPTAIGKTALSIKLANAFHTEIISADSRQFFKEMQIGTAAPSKSELAEAPHHFIHHLSIEDDYSVGDFEKEALQKVEDLFKKHDVLILVGGSGLYIKALLEGLDEFPEVAPEIRFGLNERLELEGLPVLQQQLKELDPQYYTQIDINNPHRVIRALEISLASGKPFSSFLNKPSKERNFKTIQIGLTADREDIYDRINRRVDIMMDEGLMEEAQALYPKRKLNALNTVGYKEIFAFFEGRTDLETAVEEIKKNTRRFAKRQLTWFRKDKSITWFDYTTPTSKITDFIEEEISRYEA